MTLLTYDLPDPELRAYDHGVGTLSIDGGVVGHLASVVFEMRFPSRQPWVWFVIVWLDGSREFKFEDHGPGWWTVRELDAGFFEHHGPSVVGTPKRFLWFRLQSSTPGESTTFDFAWLPADVAAQRWQDFGLTDSDF